VLASGGEKVSGVLNPEKLARDYERRQRQKARAKLLLPPTLFEGVKLLIWILAVLSSISAVVFLVYWLLGRAMWIEQTQKPGVKFDDAELGILINQSVEFWSSAHRFSGIDGFLLIQKDGQTVFSQSYGKESLDASRPMSERSTFQIGQMSEQFTAAVILQLEEQGRLKTSMPVCVFVDHYCNGDLGRVTIEHLLRHLSGMPYHPSASTLKKYRMSRRSNLSLKTRIETEAPTQVLFTPGEVYSHSELGYLALSMVIEKVTETPFAEAITRILRQDAGLSDTQFVPLQVREAPTSTDGYVLFYLPYLHDALFLRAKWLKINPGVGFGATGAVTSAADLGRWAHLLLTSSFIAEPARNRLFSARLEKYAAGFQLYRHQLRGDPIYLAQGQVSGFFSFLSIFPQSGISVIWLSNSPTFSADGLAIQKEFQNLILGADYKITSGRALYPRWWEFGP